MRSGATGIVDAYRVEDLSFGLEMDSNLSSIFPVDSLFSRRYQNPRANFESRTDTKPVQLISWMRKSILTRNAITSAYPIKAAGGGDENERLSCRVPLVPDRRVRESRRFIMLKPVTSFRCFSLCPTGGIPLSHQSSSVWKKRLRVMKAR
jgi:hypothetical protein